jgi:ATP-dependent Lon protease
LIFNMSASRWHTGQLEVLDWLQDPEKSLKDLLLPSIFTRLQKKDEQDEGAGNDSPSQADTVKYPEVLPILPLRGVVVYPQTAVPLTIGQIRSIKLVDEASVTPGKMIALVASRNPEIEEPGAADLYPVGTIATIHQLFRVPDNTIRLLVQGLARFRLGEFVQADPYLKAHVEVIPETVESGLEIEALARSARDQFEQISALTPLSHASWWHPLPPLKIRSRPLTRSPTFNASNCRMHRPCWIWIQPPPS